MLLLLLYVFWCNVLLCKLVMFVFVDLSYGLVFGIGF